MSLGDDLAAALPELRAHAESMMRDSIRVEHATGTHDDPVSLETVTDYETVYEGKARVQRPGNQPSERAVGEVEFGLATVLVQVPLAAVGVKRRHRVTVTAVDAGSDPELVGLVATVQANLTKSHPTKRTLVCEEVS